MLNAITDDKTFWKVVKPYFFKKSTRNEKITLVEENQVSTPDEAVAEKLSSYFETIVKNLDLQNKTDNLTDDTLNDIAKKFENYPDLMKIKENKNKNFKFSFLDPRL